MVSFNNYETKITRELDLEEVLSFTIGLYAEKFPELFTPFLIVGIFNGILFEELNFSPLSFFFQKMLEQFGVFDVDLSILFLISATWIVFTIAEGFCIKFATDTIAIAEKARVIKALVFTIRKLPKLLIVGIITGLIISVGMQVFVFPGIVFALFFSLTVPVMIIEETGILDSFWRSLVLVTHGLLKTVLLLLTISVVVVFFSLMGEAIGFTLNAYRYLTQSMFLAFVQPLFPIALTLHCYSMRSKETALD